MGFEQFVVLLREMLDRLDLDPESAGLLLESILKELSTVLPAGKLPAKKEKT